MAVALTFDPESAKTLKLEQQSAQQLLDSMGFVAGSMDQQSPLQPQSIGDALSQFYVGLQNQLRSLNQGNEFIGNVLGDVTKVMEEMRKEADASDHPDIPVWKSHEEKYQSEILKRIVTELAKDEKVNKFFDSNQTPGDRAEGALGTFLLIQETCPQLIPTKYQEQAKAMANAAASLGNLDEAMELFAAVSAHPEKRDKVIKRLKAVDPQDDFSWANTNHCVSDMIKGLSVPSDKQGIDAILEFAQMLHDDPLNPKIEMQGPNAYKRALEIIKDRAPATSDNDQGVKPSLISAIGRGTEGIAPGILKQLSPNLDDPNNSDPNHPNNAKKFKPGFGF